MIWLRYDETAGISTMLTPDEKRELLEIARSAIESVLDDVSEAHLAERIGRQEHLTSSNLDVGQARLTSSGSDVGQANAGDNREALLKPQGAFVTIKVAGQLRGCIGYIESPMPLMKVVAEVAEKAAFEDPRFPPLSSTEYENSTIEISVLSELKPLGSPEEIELGVHGLLLESGEHRGLLLPQVAAEQGWDRDMFFAGLARKAGLPGIPWDDPLTRLYSFRAEIVHEDGAATRA